MRSLLLVVAAASLFLAGPAEAQLSRRSIAAESGISADLGAGSGARGVLALAATAWLDGPAEAVARVAFGSAGETGGRGAAAVAGTLGIRLSAGSGPLRPQLQVDAGWARVDAGTSTEDRFAWGIGAGLEWFPALDLSVGLRAGLRGRGGEALAEAVVSAAAYF